MNLIKDCRVTYSLMFLFFVFTVLDFLGFCYVLVDPSFESNGFVKYIWINLGKEWIFAWKSFWFFVTCFLTVHIENTNPKYAFFLMLFANIVVVYALYKLYEVHFYLREAGLL